MVTVLPAIFVAFYIVFQAGDETPPFIKVLVAQAELRLRNVVAL